MVVVRIVVVMNASFVINWTLLCILLVILTVTHSSNPSLLLFVDAAEQMRPTFSLPINNNNIDHTPNNHNNNDNNKGNSISNSMGQAVRMMKYDRTANERNAISALNLLRHDNINAAPLSWYRLDDGVMGGRSETEHSRSSEDNGLHFQGMINTDGGGFCSVRARLDGTDENGGNTNGNLPPDTRAIRVVLDGDGKTYKFIMTDKGSATSTFGGTSWQVDIPTSASSQSPQTVLVDMSKMKPSFGGGPSRRQGNVKPFAVEDMTEIGFMLSLKLSDGSPNPKETFGEGIFPFSLKVHSIEPVTSTSTSSSS